jgi:molybdopterin biosynthesis enzyme
VQPLAMHGGGDVVTLSDATCFIVLAEDKASVEAGDEVDVLVLEGE